MSGHTTPAGDATLRPLKCHRCGSAELVLREKRYEEASYDGGLYLTEDGRIKAAGGGYSNAGGILPHLTEIECEGCGHAWHPRRQFAGGDA